MLLNQTLLTAVQKSAVPAPGSPRAAEIIPCRKLQTDRLPGFSFLSSPLLRRHLPVLSPPRSGKNCVTLQTLVGFTARGRCLQI